MASANSVTQVDDRFDQEEGSEDLAKKNRFARNFYVGLGIFVVVFLWVFPTYIQFLDSIRG